MKRAVLDEGMRRELETIRSTQWNVTASLEEGLARCRVLLEQAGGPASLRDIAFADAADLVGWGFALAMDAGQYDEAVQWIELLIRHPDFPHESAMDRAYRTHQHATAVLFAGEMEEATALYRSALEMVKDRPGHGR